MTDTTKPGDRSVLVLWSDSRRGIRSVASTICGVLREEPHQLDVIQVDLPDALAARSLVQQVASIIGTQLEATVVSSLGWPAVQDALSGRRPQVVVVLDPVAAAAVDAWRAKAQIWAPVVGIACGLRLDPAWARTAVDRLVVADELQGEAALELGLPAECLVPAGVPVCGGFSSTSPDDKEELRKPFDLPAGRPVVLVVTDGMESDQLTGALFQLGMVAEQATLLFDVAKDDQAADLLRRRAGLYDIQARLFGKVEQAGQLWAAADVVVARPLLYVEQRVIPNRLPLIAYLPKGEAERQTAAIYRDRGIGRLVEHAATLAAEVEVQLLPERLQAARQKMREITKVCAVNDVARVVAQVRANADEIMAEVRAVEQTEKSDEQPPDSEATPQPPAKPKGPLEIIGAQPDAEAEQPSASTLADLEVAETLAGKQVLEH